MEVTKKDGVTLSKEIQYPKGNTRNPVTMEDCTAKFKKCAQYSLKPFSESRQNSINEFVQEMENVEDAARLSILMVPAGDLCIRTGSPLILEFYGIFR